jgi:mercuric ion binding protein
MEDSFVKNFPGLTLSAALYLLFVPVGLATPAEATLVVEHMDCATCPVVVRAALYDLDGVEDVKVSMKEKAVRVIYDSERLTEDSLAQAVKNAGFPATISK